MAKISLRLYNQEIENLINRGESEEAIAHCKYILKLFPKHIDTYRLLGKAYLENQRYTEASDILKRVLSVIPDDFISQIGLSIIREDEGNLDAAIWHMERAFEVQPSNAAIQEELRRLYGKRDGLQPHRVRLTRGALVRMYAKGELYPQAIAEARAALAEDPQRTDLMIILARCYFNSGQEVEATEVCSRLLSKLPFCYEANRILSLILPKTSKSEDAKIYQQRVNALDPYHGLTSPNAPTSDQVPDNAVTIERLIWQPSQEGADQPDWAKSVGVDIKGEDTNLPDWMKAIPERKETDSDEGPEVKTENQLVESSIFPDDEQGSQEEEEEQIAVELEDENLIPDWMQGAGWAKSDGLDTDQDDSEIETPSVPLDFEDEVIQQDEVPDWIKSLAPQEELEDVQTPDDSEKLEMLNKILPPAPADLFDEESEESESSSEDIETIYQEEVLSGTQQSSEPLTTSTEEIEPSQSEYREEPVPDTEELPESEEIPDWLKSFSDEELDLTEDEPSLNASEEMPDWLKALPVDDFGEIESPIAKQDVGANDIEILRSSETESLTDEDDDWLDKLAQEHSSTQETLITPDKKQPDAPPEWLSETDKQDEFISGTEEPEFVPSLKESDEFSPDISGSEESNDSELSDLEDSLQEELDEGFAWLESLAAKQGADEATLTLEPEDRIQETPEWLKDFGETEPPQGLENQPAFDVLETPSNLDQPAEQTDEWISEFEETPQFETTAVDEDHLQQFSDKEQEIVSDTSGLETTDTEPQTFKTESESFWSEESSVELQDASESVASMLEEELESLSQEEDYPIAGQYDAPTPWEEDQPAIKQTETSEDLSPTQETAEQDINNLPDTEPQNQFANILSSSTLQSETTPDLSGLQDDLSETETFMQKEEETVEAELKAEEEFGLSVESADETDEQTDVTEETKPDSPAFDGEDVFAWLESLAQKQGADEETLITKPEERTETPPEWLTEASILDDMSLPDQPDEAEAEVEAEALADLDFDQEEPTPSISDSSVEDTQETVIHRVESTDTQEESNLEESSPDITETFEPDVTPSLQADSGRENLQEQIGEVDLMPNWLEGLESEITSSQDIDIDLIPTDETREEFPETGTAEIYPESLEEVVDKPLESFESIEGQQSAEQPLPDQQLIQTSKETILESITETGQSEFLPTAREALANQNIEAAFEAYSKAIQEGDSLDQIIEDLNQAVYQHPLETTLWLVLGDAFSQKGEIQKALDAYSKGEELLQ